MTYDPATHHRRSVRLRGFDYTRPCACFLTICTRHRECLFGEIANGRTCLNAVGDMIAREWAKTAGLRENIELDDWVVMPDHFHAIVVITDAGNASHALTREGFGKPVRNSIPTLVRSFKSATTRDANELRGTPGAALWQRNYWERIVRDDLELGRIRAYIRGNPMNWRW